MDFLVSTASAALLADPGAGKTSITLAAYEELSTIQIMRNAPSLSMLVVAPLRVCQLVWRQEAQKWSQFRHLRIGLLHGPKKDDILKNRADYDILLINYEGLDWLCDKFYARQLPFDIVAADELTKLKDHTGKRAKKFRNCTKKTPFKWGLTGTPIPNGYMDLFGQFLWLDPEILGSYITHFRDQYFKPDFTGFKYTLQAGAAERIEKRIENNVYRLAYDAMPARDVPIEIEFDKKSLQRYRELKKEMLLELPEGVITTANAAGVQQKLEQLANGAVYLRAGEKEFAVVHDLKLDALEELIEEMNGQQLLIAYQFEHDLLRIQKRFPNIPVLRGNERQVQQFEDDWNAGKITEMLVHPASVGHGLNLQKSSARHICWFSATFNLEHWDQLIRRLRRTGSNAKEILNHILVVKGTVDELKLEVLSDKDAGQARLLQGFKRLLSEDTNDGNVRNGPRLRPLRVDGACDPGEDDSGAERGAAGRGHDVPRADRDPAGEIQGGGDGHGEERSGVATAHLRGASEDGHRGGVFEDSERQEPSFNHGDDHMTTGGFRRLPRQDDGQQEQEAAPAAPKGWGKPAAAAPAPAPAQREAIRARVAAPQPQPAAEMEEQSPAPANGRSFFSRGVQAQLGGDAVQETAEKDTVGVPEPAEVKPTRTRRATSPAQSAGEDKPLIATTTPNTLGVTVTVAFQGEPAAVKQAMRDYLAA